MSNLGNKHWAHAILGQHSYDGSLHLNHHLATCLNVSCSSFTASTDLQDHYTTISGPGPVIFITQHVAQA